MGRCYQQWNHQYQVAELSLGVGDGRAPHPPSQHVVVPASEVVELAVVSIAGADTEGLVVDWAVVVCLDKHFGTPTGLKGAYCQHLTIHPLNK